MKRIYTFFLFVSIALVFWSCASEDASFAAEASNDSGVGGSYARFVIVNNAMYIVDDTNVKTFDVSTPSNPTLIDEQSVGERIESIFNFQDKLFIGSSIGLFIYQITDTGIPTKLSETTYFEFDIFPCDPVVANDSLAFVTLNSETRINTDCGGSFNIDVNVLKIFDITNIEQPQLMIEYPFLAPKGLGLDGTTLFICDHTEGLKVFDTSDPYNLQQLAHINNFTAFDVIPLDGLLLVVGPDNVYQFDYTDLTNISLVSTIPYGS